VRAPHRVGGYALQFLILLLGQVFLFGQPTLVTTPAPEPGPPSGQTRKDDRDDTDRSTAAPAAERSYDAHVLADDPVAYWTLDGSAEDATAAGRHDGAFRGGAPGRVSLPNGDTAARFDGATQFVEVPTSRAFSISTTGALTWEIWVRPDTLNFPETTNGYVDFLGKCAEYAPSCEWEGRFYGKAAGTARAGRISAYAFNPSAGLGSGDYWQGRPGTVRARQWLHVVAQYQTRSTPPGCDPTYPGTVKIWVNGVPQNFTEHAPTGCLSQYGVQPRAGDSPLTIGTLAEDSWFAGGIGKVAVYDRLLPASAVAAHYRLMTGQDPEGHCEDLCTLSG
jgi:hypothetical protein